MTTYAVIITLIFGIVVGAIAHASFEEWTDSRARAKRRKAKAKAQQSGRFSEETEDSMQQAVDLVKDKLGGEVIAIETHKV